MGSKQQAARCSMPGGVGHPRSWMLGRLLAVSPPTARLAVLPQSRFFFFPCQNNLANCNPNLGWRDNNFRWVKSHAGARLAPHYGSPGLGVSCRRLLDLVVQPSPRRPCRICIAWGMLGCWGDGPLGFLYRASSGPMLPGGQLAQPLCSWHSMLSSVSRLG